MKVEELIIDGFKSYATRTVISGWDPQFNAITGLNGSGKSNILDAICFVLGIASMSTVRAQNLQDLIYKRGQAGVTKASVTIVFDNGDKEKAPIGFEHCTKISVTRQIILGGTSKYLVNGHKAQQQTVLNLFQSVQLNINNPNFLIMQGKITKVLNSRPAEILALIEEAAGTRTFEDRKEKAERTMQKKDAKLQEISSLLKQEVEPKLEKLRKEKRLFIELQTVQTDLETLTRVIACYNYRQHSSQFDYYASLRTQHELLILELNAQIARLTSETQALASDLEHAKKERDAEVNKGGAVESLEQKEGSLSDDMTRSATSRDLTLESLNAELARLTSYKQQLVELQALVASHSENYAKAEEKHRKDQELLAQLKEEYNRKEELFSTLSTGISAKGGTEGGYEGELKRAKEEYNRLQTTTKQSQLRLKHLREKVLDDEARIVKAKEDNHALRQEIDEYQAEIEGKEARLKEFGFDGELLNRLREEERQLHNRLNGLHQELNQLKREVGNFEFSYIPPPDFDQRAVKGVAMQLFTLQEQHSDKALALQVCAGGKLYNVVVDTARNASVLLDRGQLKRRVTIVPLDKISGRQVPRQTVEYAANKCPGKVELAIDLVNFEQELQKAMNHIFGTTFVCLDPATANAVTFDPKIRARSITLQGDVYDPDGSLSGGARRGGTTILLLMQRYNALTHKIREAEADARRLQGEVHRLEQIGEQTKTLQSELNLSKHELSLLHRKLESNPAAMLIKENEQSEQEIERLESDTNSAKDASAALSERIRHIENDMREFSQDKGTKLQQLQDEVAEAKVALANHERAMREHFETFQNFQLEAEQQKAERLTLEESIAASSKSIAELERSIAEADQRIEHMSAELEAVRAELEEERLKIIGFAAEIEELTRLIATKTEELGEAERQVQRLNHDFEKANSATTGLKIKLDELISNNEWLADDKVVEAVIHKNPGINIKESEERAAVMKSKFENLQRKVNPNIMSHIDNVEKKETALKQMIRTIVRDKKKIKDTIERLDGYKRDTLNQTYQKVSDDFGQVFADLLPGSLAKLVPVNMMDVTKGLNVKVKLGPVWKESLVELSGGQRSLVALSLIMALLQFKPAPMYILDEVDAALDLSHTQNIGHLIKTRFKGSQFIVVSLKEGMFTNANRVFRTRFQDGTSVVSVM